jgi:hypothetical protein
MKFFNDETETTVEIKRGDVIALANGIKVFVEALDSIGNIWYYTVKDKEFVCTNFKNVTKVA